MMTLNHLNLCGLTSDQEQERYLQFLLVEVDIPPPSVKMVALQ